MSLAASHAVPTVFVEVIYLSVSSCVDPLTDICRNAVKMLFFVFVEPMMAMYLVSAYNRPQIDQRMTMGLRTPLDERCAFRMTLATDEILLDALHWDMLTDWERNSAYQQALTVAVSERRKAVGTVRVLDVGSGVGLLSLMAVSAGADKVVGCEVNPETARLARKIVGRNVLQEKIEILDVHSTAVSPDQVGTVDVCVAEIFDSELLGEGMLRTISDVGRRLVARNCRFIPASATVWAEPVTSPTLFRSLRYPGQRGNVVVPQTVLNSGVSTSCPMEHSGRSERRGGCFTSTLLSSTGRNRLPDAPKSCRRRKVATATTRLTPGCCTGRWT